jgi:hypothetical protein
MKLGFSVQAWHGAPFAVLAFAAASAHAQGVFVRGFEGTSQLDNCALNQCFRPPDSMGAVGLTQFFETTNGSVSVYDKATGALSGPRITMGDFWANAGLPGGANGDQRVLFDHYTNRWLVSGFGGTPNLLNIAVSDTANAAGPWKAVQIAALPAGQAADFPTLAMDDKGVYIGSNNFNASNAFLSTSLRVIPKTSLFGGAPSTTGMTTFTTPSAGADNGFTIQAAVNWQGNANNTASVMATAKDGTAQVFYKLNGVNGPDATQTNASAIAGSEFGFSLNPGQPDQTRSIDPITGLITANAVQVNGKVYAVASVSADDVVGTNPAIRWTVVDAASGKLLSSGKIQDKFFDYFQGAIAVNEFGEAVISYNRSGYQTTDLNGDGKADGNISFMARAFDVSGDLLVQDGNELLLRVSDVSNYHCTVLPPATTCRERWGDYAAVSIDPSDHHKFYAIGEYAAPSAVIPGTVILPNVPRSIWHTYVAEITQTSAVPEAPQGWMLMAGLALLGGAVRSQRFRSAGF